MQYICIDLGDKRCGIATSRENIAFAKDIVQRVDLIKYLKKYLSCHDISFIIIGLPYDLYGIDTQQLEKTQKFIEKLESIFPLQQVIGHDERFSSFQAQQGFDDHRDDIAAQCILQSYLDSRG